MAQDKCSNIVEEFEPCCTWKKEEHQDTVEIQLPAGFKKENLRIQFISALGELKIEGKVDEPKSNYFKKFIYVPNSNLEDIHARFSNGILYVTIKKNLIPCSCTQQNQDGNKDDKMRNCCRASRWPESTATNGDVKMIRDCKAGIKLGGKKGWALAFLMLALASGVYSAYKLYLPYFRVQDCPCMAYKSRESGVF